jgi:hypothetical protein
VEVSVLSRTTYAALTLLPLILPSTGLAIETTGLDAITTPGQPVEVRAKFERSFWLFKPDIKRKPVTFRVDGETLRGITDRDGVASATVTRAAVGVYPIVAALDGKPGAPARGGRLWVLDPARPVAVVDIDGTLSDLNDLLVPFFGARAKAFPGSPELLRELATRYQIVYLTARDDVHDARTRAFLARHAFPDGPIIYDDLGFTTRAELRQLAKSNHGAFKLGQLHALEAHGVSVAIGIGNSETDAWAYEQAGLPSYINTRVAGTGPSFRFTSYVNELRPRLLQDGALVATPGLAASVP